MSNLRQPKSAMDHILRALIPYTRENLQLSFHPSQFFNELERSTGYKRETLQTTAWRAEKDGFISRNGRLLSLTAKGKRKIHPFVATKLKGNARLMIVFDIPENKSYLRRQLRLLLREWRFEQVQKSVWISDYDSREILTETVEELDIKDYIQVFECARLYP